MPGLALAGFVAAAGAEPSAERGEYVFRATGGCSCHTNAAAGGALMAGGRPIATPFGAVYSTNITPDVETGIGAWSDRDFTVAMTEGVGPDGTHFFPAFPYTSFTRMTEEDLLDLKAYLFTLSPVSNATPPPDIPLHRGWRAGVAAWNFLYFSPGTFAPEPDSSEAWNRGNYLATALGHCAECHTPRDFLGGMRRDLAYAGTSAGPEGEAAPNITPNDYTGGGGWNSVDMVWFLQTGLKPDGDSASGTMMELIENGYQYMTEEDLAALALYLQSLAPIGSSP